jgi:hypothetical protein
MYNPKGCCTEALTQALLKLLQATLPEVSGGTVNVRTSTRFHTKLTSLIS